MGTLVAQHVSAAYELGEDKPDGHVIRARTRTRFLEFVATKRLRRVIDRADIA